MAKKPVVRADRVDVLRSVALNHARQFERSLTDFYDVIPSMDRCIADAMVAVVLYTEQIVKRETRERKTRERNARS